MVHLVRFLFLVLVCQSALATETWVAQTGTAHDFPLATRSATASIHYADTDAKVVAIAAGHLADDVERVTGRKMALNANSNGPMVLIGTLGHSPFIDRLAASGQLDATRLAGAWESFIIATVQHPFPGVAQALVIAGSDRRGTAFGAYELSQAIGVSPWYWWADVVPAKRQALYIRAGTRRFGPPSVKYRGIFINDEDWGLQPWAARTFEPEHGGIGPKTYTRVFELLLRLKANTLWPAMHASTPAFNSFPQNAQLADDYAVVMGSSHAEPMLRNNVSEWKDGPGAYNYQTNRDGVLRYWTERVAANAIFENFYTVGMRGVHDSRMQGPATDPERISLLQQIFADQRALLAAQGGPSADRIPQLFCAYKEVLGLYRQGLQVPEDVTIMWPDDNFGYIRGFANAAERARPGGFGVYYHLSYLGAPMSYLWLSTTPPALVWSEMSKAYDTGARRIWIANVGDIKPAEVDTELFLQMAWDARRWTAATLPRFLPEWARREFGAPHADEIAAIMQGYYRLNYRRKPEQLQWWLPKEAPRHSDLSAQESQARLAQFAQLNARAERVARALDPSLQDAFFELVAYPVAASALANRRLIEGERANLAAALAANARLEALTARWNTTLAGGKWRHIMAEEPADSQWRSLRAARWTMPAYSAPATLRQGPIITLEAERYDHARQQSGAAWTAVAGLGRSGAGAVTVLPASAPAVSLEQARNRAPRLAYRFRAAEGVADLAVHLVPTHPISGNALRLAVAIDDGPLQLLALELKDGGADWAAGVLDARRTARARMTIGAPGAHTLYVYGIDPGVTLDRIDISFPAQSIP